MFDTILVPTDGSENAKDAARDAIEIAKDSGATVHALYVMDIGDAAFVSVPSDIKETRDRLEEKGHEYVEFVEMKAKDAGINCVTAVKSGTPVEEIVEYAEDHGIELIVMGKRGRSDPDKPAIGSITNRVIGATDITVLTA